MRTYKIYLSVILTILLLTGCGNDDILTSNENEVDGRVPLQVGGGIQTRAVDNEWEAGDVIGIYMLIPENSAVDTYSNVPYEVAEAGVNGTFKPIQKSMTIYLPVDGSKRDFIAYYPYEDQLKGTNYSIDVSAQDDQSKIDFMVAERVTGKSRNNAKVAFRFKHKLAKVLLSIKTGNGFSDNQEELKNLKTVMLTNQQITGSYDVLNGGDIVGTSEKDDISLKVNKDDLTNCTAEGIIFPCKGYTDMVLQFDMGDSGLYEWKLIESMKSQKFEAGKKYKYDITINKSGIDMSSTISDWIDGNGDGESGSAE